MINAQDMDSETTHVARMGDMEVEVRLFTSGPPRVVVFYVASSEMDHIVGDFLFKTQVWSTDEKAVEDDELTQLKSTATLWATTDYRTQFTLQEFVNKVNP